MDVKKTALRIIERLLSKPKKGRYDALLALQLAKNYDVGDHIVDRCKYALYLAKKEKKNQPYKKHLN